MTKTLDADGDEARMRTTGPSDLRPPDFGDRELVDAIDGIVWEAETSACRFTFVSKQAERVLGYPVAQWLEVPSFRVDRLHPDDRDEAVALCRRATAERRPHTLEYRMIAADGRAVWLRDTVTVVVENDRPVSLRGVMVDITDRRRTEAVRDGQTVVLELIARGAPLSETLGRLATFVESQGDGMLCSVLLLEDDGRHVRHAAAPSLPEAYVRAVDGAEIGPRAGSCGTAMYERRQVVVTDIMTDPLWDDYRHLAAAHGLRACWSTPILSNEGMVLGSFASYYRDVRSPVPWELHLIEIATRLAGIAMERKRSEDAIRRSEERYRSLVANVPDVHWTADALGRVVFISPNIERAFGFTQGDIYRHGEKLWFGRMHPDDIHRVKEAYALLFARLDSFDVEYRIQRKDGEWIWWHDRAFTVYERDGVLFADGLLSDVTARKRTEAALREAEDRYRNIFENAVEGVFRTTPQGRFLVANPAVADMLGYASAGELLGELTDIGSQLYVDPSRRLEYQRLLEEQGRVKGFQIQLRRKDGRPIWVSVNTRAVREGGTIAYYEGMAEDITERKNLEERIRQGQKMEAVGRLAGGIAHDFNNLLTVIQGFSEIGLAKLTSADPLHTDLTQIQVASVRAAKLVQQLLAFSRKQPLRLEPLDLAEVIRHLDPMLRRLVEEDIVFEIRAGESAWRVLGDRTQLEQVIVNLVANARDAMPDGGILRIESGNERIETPRPVTTSMSVPRGDYVRIVIADTGHGMDADTASHIFEPFFTTKGMAKGTGLGLATVYGVVKQHEGFIQVESRVGLGSVFTILLPRTDSKTVPASSAVIPACRVATETILLVEDEPLVRRLASRVLADAGYRVLEAASAEVAIDILDERRGGVDLLLTDAVLPGISGPKLGEIVSSSFPGTRIVYMSGYAGDTMARHGLPDEGAVFLPKPFGVGQLLECVRRTLEAEGRPAAERP